MWWSTTVRATGGRPCVVDDAERSGVLEATRSDEKRIMVALRPISGDDATAKATPGLNPVVVGLLALALALALAAAIASPVPGDEALVGGALLGA